MSEPAIIVPVSMSASGYEDGLGRRTLEFDRETGTMLERLQLRPELRAFEAFLRDRVSLATVFDDERFARVRGVERDARHGLTVVSQFVAGNRLCDLLEAATNLPADEATSPSVDSAIGFLLEILPALNSWHHISGHAHGTLAPGRIVLTQDGRVIVVDAVFGQIIERLQFNRGRLWLEFGIASPGTDGPVRLDASTDVSQAALAAMMIVLGRPLRDNEYPDGVATLLTEVIEIAQIRGGSGFASGLQTFLARTLPLPTQDPHPSAEAAAAEVRHVAREIGAARCRTALTSFIADMNRVLLDTRERAESSGDHFDHEISAAVESGRSGVISDVDDLRIDSLLAALPDTADVPLADTGWTDTVMAVEPDVPAAPIVETTVGEQLAEESHTAVVEDVASSFAATEEVFEEAVVPKPFFQSEEPAVAPVRPAEPEPLVEVFHVPVDAAVTAVPEVDARPQPELERVTEPLPITEPQPIAKTQPVTEPLPPRAAEPEPVPATPPVAARSEPAMPPQPAPPVVSAEPVPAPAAAPAPKKQEPPPSKRKRRGSKPHRDKLRSNAAPKAPPVPPVLPLPVPLGGNVPMPTYGKVPEPLRQPAPIAIQAAQPGPIAIQGAPALRPAPAPKPPAPLRLKTEGPSGYSPAAQRNDWRDSSNVSAAPYVPDDPQPDAGGGIPWRLVAAALVLVIAGVAVGRGYLSKRGGAEPEKPAAAAAVPDPKPASSSPKLGTLALTTQPAGARVLLDGKAVGESPVTLTDLPPGKHALTIVGSSGSVKKVIRLEAGKTLSLEVPIYSGWIVVFSPVPLDIAENGRAIGTTEQGRLMLSPGLHQLTLSNRQLGYKTVQIVDIEPGEERPISVQPTGALNANAEPWAEVWMAGKKVGETPIAGLQVPLGTHEVVFKNPDFPEQRVTVTVTGSAPAIAAVNFRK
jgi:hypothetical protein